MKKILGLDIGTNSIGWAVIENDLENHEGRILGMGSRIIPMEGREKDFESGTSVTKNAERRMARSSRRLLERYKLRRTRLIRVFKELGWFPHEFPEVFKGLDQFNINKYVAFTESTIAEAKKQFNVNEISTDWLIYYLRTKALKEEISLNELARIIYHFNQRRGFKSSRKENKLIETDSDKIKYPILEKMISILKINSIIQSNDKTRYGDKYIVNAQNSDGTTIQGTVQMRSKPEWEDKHIEIEITRITNKAKEIRYEFRLPDRNDWEKRKIALERKLQDSGLHPGEYHFVNLLQDRNYRIRENVINRSFYQAEFDAIWDKQTEFHQELGEHCIIEPLVDILYKHNPEKRKELCVHDLKHLLKNDIIYYQRSLKSQKDLISECRYEIKADPSGKTYGVKVCPKSSPVFQEFRIWQDISSIRIFRNELKNKDGKIKYDVEETEILLDINGKEKLFQLFDRKTDISNKDILKELSSESIKLNAVTHRLNYTDTKIFKGNETKSFFRKIFKKHNYDEEGERFLNDSEKFHNLWHTFYSLSDEVHVEHALIKNFGLPVEVAAHISKMPEFKKDYAAYSSKAIKKFLSLMRTGCYWKEEDICTEVKEKISRIICNEENNISPALENWLKVKNAKSIKDFENVPLHIACYIIYGRHSESINQDKFESPDQIKLLPPNTLRNPIVEQVLNETLNVVKDIWNQYGRPDDIHVELARDLKKNTEERKKIADVAYKNETERKRAAAVLRELYNANPESSADIEKLRLWEETGNKTAKETYPLKSKEPTPAEIEKYLLWGEQNHISPYTGKVIPLSKLFTNEYEVEHIIPRSRFFDDSFANKTICETGVNCFKDNQTAIEFINSQGGRTVTLRGSENSIFSEEAYYQHIRNTFRGKKLRYLQLGEIPKDFIERQINDTRYITKKIAELLYPAAADNIVFTTGSITNELKDKWGLVRVWKEILRPRFERLEQITNEKLIDLDKQHNNIHFRKEYKRVDHRHHAMDAVIIAATSREHIRYLNSLSAAEEREKLNLKYRLVKSKIREFHLPWDTFSKDVREELSKIIVSHKNRTRVLSKGFNKYKKWILENGKWVLKTIKQEKGDLFSVRKSMFKEPFGIIHIAEYKDESVKKAVALQFAYLTQYKDQFQSRIADKDLRDKVNLLIKNCSFDLTDTLNYIKENPLKDLDGKILLKIQILEFKKYAAKRVLLDKSFNENKLYEIPYSDHPHNKLVNTIKEHLKEFNNKSQDAFSSEGLDILAKKFGRPINKITRFEEIGNKIELNGKLLESDKGSNTFFVIYVNKFNNRERIINEKSTISLVDAIECISNGIPVGEEKEGYNKVILSPNDLVYVPEIEEDIASVNWNDKKKIAERIYKVVSFTGGLCYFLPHYVSALIQPYNPGRKIGEFESLNKSEKSLDGQIIKKICIKIKVDRLGNIIPVK